jgi:predicted DNA-binding transcriptional regulator AlpA
MIEIIPSEFSTPMVHLTVAQIRELIREELNNALNVAPKEEKLLDTKQAAAMLSTSPDWIYRNSKKLPFTRKLAPKMVRFSYMGIVKYLATRTAN